MRYYLTLARMAIIKKSTNNAGMGVERREPLYSVGGFFDQGHSDGYEMIYHYSFDLHFSNN